MLVGQPVHQGNVPGLGELLRALEARHPFDSLEGSGAHVPMVSPGYAEIADLEHVFLKVLRLKVL